MSTSLNCSKQVSEKRVNAKQRLIFKNIRLLLANKVSTMGAITLMFIIIVAIFAPVIAPYDPLEINTEKGLVAPSSEHIFGTDDLGRDILSRIIWGGRISIWVGLSSAGISMSIGLFLGLLGGYFGNTLGFVILRLMDLLLSFPDILLALVVISILGPGINNVILAVGISATPTFTRVIYSSVLSLKENEYIESARMVGSSNTRIILKHILPNVMATVIVLFTMQVGAAIFATASLSFIGLGAQPPSPEWGAMISRGRNMLRNAMWVSTYPGLAISIIVVSINVFGDGLRDILDPRSRIR